MMVGTIGVDVTGTLPGELVRSVNGLVDESALKRISSVVSGVQLPASYMSLLGSTGMDSFAAALGEVAGASKLVASVGASLPKFEFPTLSASSILGPGYASDLLRSSGLAAAQLELARSVSVQMGSVLDGIRPIMSTIAAQQLTARAVVLEQGFLGDVAGAGAGFGRLYSQFESSPRLAAEVAGFATAATRPGATASVDVSELLARTLNVEQILEEEPALRDRLAEPLADAEDAADLREYDVIHFGEAFGVVEAVRRHQVSSLGLVAAATVGIVRFVVGAGSAEPLPVTMYEAIRDGGGMYLACVAFRSRASGGVDG